MYNYIFGPVPSRRLGMSLGIDLVPKKVCSLDCVYCEVGKTTNLTTTRKEYSPLAKIVEEIKHYLTHHSKPDYLTITGSGEPTLHSRLGELIQLVKSNYEDLKIAVITNATLLSDRQVRAELSGADVILPSLDAATDIVFNQINLPHASLSVENHVQGLVQLRESYRGKIWLEIFILPGYNDQRTELTKLSTYIKRINPDAIQLNTLDRPGVIKDLKPASSIDLERISKHLAADQLEIILSPSKQNEAVIEHQDLESLVMNTLRRRPCTIDDLGLIAQVSKSLLEEQLKVLEEANQIEVKLQKRGTFYCIKGKGEVNT